MRFVYIGELDRTPDAPDHLGIRQGLKQLGWEHLIVDPILNTKAEVINQVCSFRPDVIVHGNTDTLGLGTIDKLKEGTHAKQVFWMLDYQPLHFQPLYHGLWDEWKKAAGYLDLILLSNKDQLDFWSSEFRCPAHYLPHGCVSVDALVFEQIQQRECVFIGSMIDQDWYANRYRLIREIEGQIPISHITGGSVEDRNAVWRAMPAIYHSANAVLDISHEWNAQGYCSGRYFYTAGYGAACVTKRFPGCEELYADKKHKLYFDTPAEAITLIKLLNRDEGLREHLKVSAWEHTKAEHNYTKRFTQLVNFL